MRAPHVPDARITTAAGGPFYSDFVKDVILGNLAEADEFPPGATGARPWSTSRFSPSVPPLVIPCAV